MKFITLLPILAAGFPLSAFAQVSNGDFETPNISNVGLVSQNYSAISTALNGWTVFNGTVALIDKAYTQSGVAYLPNSGDQSLALNGAANASSGVIYQNFATIPGETYSLSFALGSVGSPATVGLLVGNSVNTFSASSGTPGTLTWETQVLTFTATSQSTLLHFSNLGQNFVGLDSISVTPPAAVPEAGTFLMSTFGLAFLLRRRRA